MSLVLILNTGENQLNHFNENGIQLLTKCLRGQEVKKRYELTTRSLPPPLLDFGLDITELCPFVLHCTAHEPPP